MTSHKLIVNEKMLLNKTDHSVNLTTNNLGIVLKNK